MRRKEEIQVFGLALEGRKRETVSSETYLNLSDREVEEGHSLSNLDDGLGTNATHGRSETSVQLEYSELVEQSGVVGLGKIGIGDNLLGLGRFNLGPVAVRRRRGEEGEGRMRIRVS